MWFKAMIKLRTNIKLFSLFAFIFFAASLGSFKGLVLCYGADGHIHTEITFNGVDCGHFPKTARDVPATDFLKKFNPIPHANHCISCTDIPLSYDYSLKNFNKTNTHNKSSKLRTPLSLFLSVPIGALLTSPTVLSKNHPDPLSPSLNLIQSTILLL